MRRALQLRGDIEPPVIEPVEPVAIRQPVEGFASIITATFPHQFATGSTITISPAGGPLTQGTLLGVDVANGNETTLTVAPRYRTMEIVGNGWTNIWALPSKPRRDVTGFIVSCGYITEGDVYYSLHVDIHRAGTWFYSHYDDLDAPDCLIRPTPLPTGATAYFTYEEA